MKKTKYFGIFLILVSVFTMSGCVDISGDTTENSYNADNSVNNSNNTIPESSSGTEPVIEDSEYPAIPDYPAGANSIGQLDLNCKDDIIYYTLSYVCFKDTVRLSTTTDSGEITEDEDTRIKGDPWVYYERGHIDREGKSDSITVTGTVTGGNPGGTYTAKCESL